MIGGIASSIPGIISGGSIGGMASSIPGMIGSAAGVIGNVGSIFGGMFGDQQPGSIPGKPNGSIFGQSPSGDTAGVGNLFSETTNQGAFNKEPSLPDSSSELTPSLTTNGNMIEDMSTSLDSSKQELMLPPSQDSSQPIVVNGGGGGGGGSSGGVSESNPSVGGVMGVDIGVRNEEATLLRAQFGSVRIV